MDAFPGRPCGVSCATGLGSLDSSATSLDSSTETPIVMAAASTATAVMTQGSKRRRRHQGAEEAPSVLSESAIGNRAGYWSVTDPGTGSRSADALSTGCGADAEAG